MTDQTKPKRISLSEILELLLTRGRTEHSGVTLGRNPKGDTLIEVTVRTGDEGVASIAAAELLARETYDRLRAEYPATNGTFSGSEVALTRNAKGETQAAVTVKAADSADAHGLALAEAEAIASYDRLVTRYPLSSGHTVAPPAEPAASRSRSKAAADAGKD